MNFKFSLLALVILLSACDNPHANLKIDFNENWQFIAQDIEGSETLDFDDASWRTVNVPHDWSIEGNFSQDNPSFSRGGWLPTSKLTYRKTFKVPQSQKNKRFVIYFDGAYRNSRVYINGHFLGLRPFGYSAFYYDMSDYIKAGEKNVITVKLDNTAQPGARWYTGTGIYRDVHLLVTDHIYIPVWGNYIVANSIDNDKATLNIETQLVNDTELGQEVELRHTAIDAQGLEVGSTTEQVNLIGGLKSTVKTELTIAHPNKWTTEHPYQYTIKTQVLRNNKVIYAESNKTGVRSLLYDAQEGFKLNGKVIKIKGVCLHPAGGPLGAAIQRRTIERQLEKLREMGCNAIRTAHNPFSEEFLDVCDSMGFLVLNEMFDEWEIVKQPSTTQNGKKVRIPVKYYADLFKKWSSRDLTDFVLRDRNHPSVIMWSIGNEIAQMRSPEGQPIAEHLTKIIHDLDYRPVTNGVNGYGWGLWPDPGAAATSDIYGYNYITDEGLAKERKTHPNTKAIITEHESAQSFYPRSTYLYGQAKKDWWNKLNYKYDEAYKWVEKRDIRGESGMEAWRIVKNRPYLMGLFIWTGWDYLGEVIPFGWPARSSSFAPIDLAGFPKDGYYFYQSQWTNKPMVHIFPHWNLTGMEGKTVQVYGYTNGNKVELFQDGHSLGIRQNNTDSVQYQTWDVVYRPGVLKAVAYKDGKVVAEETVKTAGQATQIRVESRRQEMQANGRDLIYVECTILDQDGNEVPTANNLLKFKLTGPANIAGVANGDNMGLEPFKAKQRTAFNGKCLVILQSTKKAGNIQLTISSDELKSTSTAYRSL